MPILIEPYSHLFAIKLDFGQAQEAFAYALRQTNYLFSTIRLINGFKIVFRDEPTIFYR